MFKEKKVREIIAEEMKHKMKIKGIKCKADLIMDIAPLGRIEKWYHDTGKIKELVLDENTKKYVPEEKVEGQEYDIYIFKVWRCNWLLRELKIGYNTFILIDRECLEIGSNKSYASSWTLKPNTHFERFGGVFTTSRKTMGYLYDMCMKYFGESTLDHMVNSSNRVIYHDLAHVKSIDRLDKKDKIKREGYEKAKKARAAESDDIDESDE